MSRRRIDSFQIPGEDVLLRPPAARPGRTVAAYPTGGGPCTVAKENLGTIAGPLAASALRVDCVLNVAVAIAAGVAALTSAVPTLHQYTLPMCLAVLAVVTLAT